MTRALPGTSFYDCLSRRHASCNVVPAQRRQAACVQRAECPRTDRACRSGPCLPSEHDRLQTCRHTLRCHDFAALLDTGSGHRLFLISRKTVAPIGAEGGPVEEFVVLGATGGLPVPRDSGSTVRKTKDENCHYILFRLHSAEHFQLAHCRCKYACWLPGNMALLISGHPGRLSLYSRACNLVAGSVYTVKVGRHPSCSCPDAAKGNLCKHHLVRCCWDRRTL